MKTCLLKLKEQLEKNGIETKSIRYVGPGKILVGIGFDAWNSVGKVCVEPKQGKEYFVAFYPHQWERMGAARHYSVKKDGYQPVITQHISELRKDLFEFFKIY